MGIAYEFFKDEEPNIGNIENQLIFFIENYAYMMLIYRVMTKQLEKTKKKKENAHKQLQELRATIDQIEQNKTTLSEQEKLELQERKNYLTKLREENDIVYFYGHPMEYDTATKLILRYQKIFKILEPFDAKGRKRVASILRTGSKIFTSPVCSLLKFTSKNVKKRDTKNAVKEARKIVLNFPPSIYKKIMSSVNVDLSEHVPPE